MIRFLIYVFMLVFVFGTEAQLTWRSWISTNSQPWNAAEATNIPATQLKGVISGTSIPALTLSGGASGSGTTAITLTLANPSASTLGGIESLAPVSHKWINTISTAGVPSATQPSWSDLSSTPTTFSGYGISDTWPNLASALSGSLNGTVLGSGTVADGALASTFLKANQTITLSGDATGSGMTSIAVTVTNAQNLRGALPVLDVSAATNYNGANLTGGAITNPVVNVPAYPPGLPTTTLQQQFLTTPYQGSGGLLSPSGMWMTGANGTNLFITGTNTAPWFVGNGSLLTGVVNTNGVSAASEVPLSTSASGAWTWTAVGTMIYTNAAAFKTYLDGLYYPLSGNPSSFVTASVTNGLATIVFVQAVSNSVLTTALSDATAVTNGLQIPSTNIVTQAGALAASSNATNYTVNLLLGSGGGDILQVNLANTNAYITFTGTNTADTKRTVLFNGWTNTRNSTLQFNLPHWRTNNPTVFSFTVSNGWSAFFTFYNPDTSGTNVVIGDNGRNQ